MCVFGSVDDVGGGGEMQIVFIKLGRAGECLFLPGFCNVVYDAKPLWSAGMLLFLLVVGRFGSTSICA